jgi:DNA modification methylase
MFLMNMAEHKAITRWGERKNDGQVSSSSAKARRTEHSFLQTRPLNDLDLNNWKAEIRRNGLLLDSLWLFPRREKIGVHSSAYRGNFVPQIPHQAIIRFTKKSEWVLDVFAGLATSLIKCERLGRNGIGIELVPQVAAEANTLLRKQKNQAVFAEVIVENSASADARKRVRAILKAHNANNVQLLILHPPYYNAIRFSSQPQDLSNASSLENFLKMLKTVITNFAPLLEDGRYMLLVIGDVFSKGEYVPLESKVIEVIQQTGLFKIKGIVVKDIRGNRGKRGQEPLWYYRALKNGLFVFKHEYVVFFQKLDRARKSPKAIGAKTNRKRGRLYWKRFRQSKIMELKTGDG